MKDFYDVIIVGKGPGGISASLYLARAKYSVLVVGRDYGALEKAEKIENYYGFPGGISGIELAKRGIEQAQSLGVEVECGEVCGITASYGSPNEFTLEFINAENEKRQIRALSVLLATGKIRRGLKIPGFKEGEGKGLSYCAVCDAFFYKGKSVGVIGNGAYALSEIEALLPLASEVTLFTNGEPLALPREHFPDNIKIEEGLLEEILISGERVSGVAVNSSGSRIKIKLDGIFVALGTAGGGDFAATLGLPLEEKNGSFSIKVNQDYSTGIPGLFAAGDLTGGFLQVANSVAQGAFSAQSINKYLKSLS